MRPLLYLTLLTTTSLAFERPEEAELSTVTPSSELDYDKVDALPTTNNSSDHSLVPTQAENNIPPPSSSKTKDTPASKTAWLGVMGDPVSEALKAQLKIDHGLVLKYIAPDSPAAKAGLKVYDVVLSLNGSDIINQTSLKKVVTQHNANDNIKLKIHSQGEADNIDVTLSEKPAPLNRLAPPRNHGNLKEIEQLIEQSGRIATDPNHEQKSGIGRMFGKILKEMAPNLELNFQSTSSIKVNDSEGSVEVQTINDTKNVIVRDHDNQVQFEGPWNTEEEITAAPTDIKRRVNNIDSSYKNIEKHLPKKSIR